MKLPFLELIYQNADFKLFVDFWSEYYSYSAEENLYTSTISKSKFTEMDVQLLFEWKNGMKINGHITKQASVDKVVSRLTHLNGLKEKFDLTDFKEHFSDIAAIWQIFLLHIIQPTQFPIFDQHVYRAHYFLLHKSIAEIPNYQPSKLKYYYNCYLPFFDTLKSEVTDLRKIDKALWAFGKFLKTNYAVKLIN